MILSTPRHPVTICQPGSDFTASDGARLAFSDEGSSAADALNLLCLSGLTRDSRDFDYLRPYIDTDRIRLITLDYRGRGASTFTGPDTYTLPREAQDAIELLDHLNLDQAVVLGTSRGGLNAMMMGVLAKHRLAGVILNDIGPEIATSGLSTIKSYIGKRPVQKSRAEMAAAMPTMRPGFVNVPMARWIAEVERHTVETGARLDITYDKRLAEVFSDGPSPDLWPLFDALIGVPLALLRGANSDLLSHESALKMAARRPDMIWAEVADRAHIPFLDEPECLSLIRTFLTSLSPITPAKVAK